MSDLTRMKAPDFSVTLPDGGTRTLAAYRGRRLLLVFHRHLA